MDEQLQSVVCRSLGRCTSSAHGQTAVWWMVVGQTRLQRDGVGSGAACHKLLCDSSFLPAASQPHDSHLHGVQLKSVA
jgi:hypothetical protein